MNLKILFSFQIPAERQKILTTGFRLKSARERLVRKDLLLVKRQLPQEYFAAQQSKKYIYHTN